MTEEEFCDRFMALIDAFCKGSPKAAEIRKERNG